MAFTSPIPPLPNDPDAALGVATGHPFSSTSKAVPKEDGYGPFLVSTGPYMIEGSEALDLTVPPDEQSDLGLHARLVVDDPGSIVLVRDPVMGPATDRTGGRSLSHRGRARFSPSVPIPQSRESIW